MCVCCQQVTAPADSAEHSMQAQVWYRGLQPQSCFCCCCYYGRRWRSYLVIALASQ